MNSGEAWTPAMASAVGARRRPTETRPYPSQPSKLLSTLRIRRYPFGVTFVKEPLEFLRTNPRSMAPWRVYAFQL